MDLSEVNLPLSRQCSESVTERFLRRSRVEFDVGRSVVGISCKDSKMRNSTHADLTNDHIVIITSTTS